MNAKTGTRKQGRIGARTRVWDRSGLRGDHSIGDDCTIGAFVEIGDGVRIGNRRKVEASHSSPPASSSGTRCSLARMSASSTTGNS